MSVEILVHISGPSRGADDARYRKEARGILEFESAETHAVFRRTEKRSVSPEKRGLKAQTATPEVRAGRRDDELQIQQDHGFQSGKPASQRTPSLLRTPAVHKTHVTPNLPWTTVKETPRVLIERTPVLPRPKTAPDVPSFPKVGSALRRTQSDSWETPPSVIPDSQPTPPSSGPLEISSSPYFKRPWNLSSSPSPKGVSSSPTAKRPRSSSPSPDEISSSPSAKRPRLQVPSSPPVEEHVDEQVEPRSASQDPYHISPSPPAVLATSLEIHPPRPKPSTGRFKTHLTPNLRLISDNLQKYNVKFTPLSTSRSIHPLERGHWLVPLSSFDPPSMTKLWDFLSQFIGSGKAGWGVWCIREMVARDRSMDKGQSDVEQDGLTTEEEVMKVYCWGEVVHEIWLALFIGSNRKIKGTGSRWIDASGQAIVIMR